MIRLRNYCAAFSAAVLACAIFCAENPAEVKPAQDVPDFALGVLTFRELGGSLEKAGLYANQLLPNSSALAKQIAMTYLFSLPVDAGLKQDGLARIYALDPISTGLQNERALALSVADAAAVKTALVGAYGAPVEADGVMTFTLPQPLPQPDKTLLIKFVGDRLLAAPNAVVLNKLEAYEKAHPGPLALKADVVASIRVGAIKKSFGELIELTLDALIDLVADEQAAQLRDIAKLVDTVWQFETVDVALRLEPKGDIGQLELTAFPRAGSPSAQKLALPGKTLSERALRLIPEKSALFAAWIVTGPELSKTLHAQIGKHAAASPEDLKPLALAFEKALIDMVEVADGEVVVSLSGTDLRSPLLLASADVSDEAAALAKATATVETLTALASAQIKKQMGPKPIAVEPLVLKKGESDVNGVKVLTFEVTPAGLTEDERLDVSELMGWPPVVRACVVDKKLILSLGRESSEDLTATIQRLKTPLNASDPGLRAMKEAVANGSQAAASLTALNAAKLILARTPLPLDTSLERLMRGLSDHPTVLSGRALNQFSFKLDLPSGAAHAIGSIFQRVDKAMRSAAIGDPAPPPPPAP